MSARRPDAVVVQDLELTVPDPQVEAEHARAIVRFDGSVLDMINVPGVTPGSPRERALRRTARRVFAELSVPPARRSGSDPTVTVIVCTRDRAAELRGCLEALARLDYPGLEIIVVDNAPTDDATAAVARSFDVEYVVEPAPGLDNARNTGLVRARGEIVAFTDDDARPEPDWLRGLVRGFESPDVGAVAGLVLPAELETHAQRLFENAYQGMRKGYEIRVVRSRGRRSPIRPELIGTGCNMAFRRDELLRLGGFDPALDVGTPSGGGGDLDAFVRVLEEGSAVEYRPDAVVRHIHRRTMPELERQLKGNGSGYAAMLAAAYARGDGGRRRLVVRRAISWSVRWHLARLARRPLGREYLPMRYIFAEFRGALSGAAAYHEGRRLAAQGPLDGDATP